MGWVSGIVVFLLVWWTALFCILPWGNRPDENPDIANAKSAPANARIRQKFMVTTLVSALIWLMIYGLIQSGVISFREMAAVIAAEESEK